MIVKRFSKVVSHFVLARVFMFRFHVLARLCTVYYAKIASHTAYGWCYAYKSQL